MFTATFGPFAMDFHGAVAFVGFSAAHQVGTIGELKTGSYSMIAAEISDAICYPSNVADQVISGTT